MNRCLVSIIGLLTLMSSSAKAHELKLSVISLEFTSPNQAELKWKIKGGGDSVPSWSPRTPRICTQTSTAPSASTNDFSNSRQALNLNCDASRMGELELYLDFQEASTDKVVARIIDSNGRVARGLLSASKPGFSMPPRKSSFTEALQYFGLGATHLLAGYDHIAFVLALVFILGWRFSLLTAVTAFTLGHSFTLVLSSLNLISLPSAWVEIGISVSVIILALDMMRESSDRKYIWLWALGFGLFHGLGFATALRELGWGDTTMIWALLGFNLGIEFAQLGILAGLGVWLYFVSKDFLQHSQVRNYASYLIGSIGAYAFIGSLLSLL